MDNLLAWMDVDLTDDELAGEPWKAGVCHQGANFGMICGSTISATLRTVGGKGFGATQHDLTAAGRRKSPGNGDDQCLRTLSARG